jgi:hypothetical protein
MLYRAAVSPRRARSWTRPSGGSARTSASPRRRWRRSRTARAISTSFTPTAAAVLDMHERWLDEAGRELGRRVLDQLPGVVADDRHRRAALLDPVDLDLGAADHEIRMRLRPVDPHLLEPLGIR